MPKLSVAVPHALGQNEVVARLKEESDVLQSSFGDHVRDFQQSWNHHTLTFGFTVLGMSVDGQVCVEPTQVLTTANVPFAAAMFKGTIEARVRSRLEELLAPRT